MKTLDQETLVEMITDQLSREIMRGQLVRNIDNLTKRLETYKNAINLDNTIIQKVECMIRFQYAFSI